MNTTLTPFGLCGSGKRVTALTAYGNGKVPIRIVCGTHRYGYALVVDTARISKVEDLESDEIKIGCVREGGAADIFLNKLVEEQ